MQSQSEKSEMLPPPSYRSCVPDNTTASSSSPGLSQFLDIVGNRETLHFHAPNFMGCVNVPQSVQVRDSYENPILSIIIGRARGIAREIISPSGESLITISTGNQATLSAGDQILGMLEEDSLSCRQTLRATNVMGNEIFYGSGDNSVGDTGCNCCLECGIGLCWPNLSEINFTHNGVTLGQLKRSTNNSSGNELVLFNPANMDPRTKAILIYASYSVYLSLFVDTQCGRIGDRGACRRIFCVIIIVSLLIMSIPIWIM